VQHHAERYQKLIQYEICIISTILYNMKHTNNLQGEPKNDPTCFCQNFVKSPPNLIIFGTEIAKMIESCNVHSMSTSYNLSPHYRVKHRCSKLLHNAELLSP